jgi:hypothetical protein
MVCQLPGFIPARRQDRRGPGHRHGAPADREWSSIPAATLTSAPPARNTRPITSICHKPRRPRPPPPVILPVGAACARPPGHDAPAPAASPRSAPPPARASDAGRTSAEGRSASPPSPFSAYRRSRPCTVCRATLYRRATSMTETPSGHFQHRPVPLLHRTQPHQHTRLPPAKRPACRKPGNQDGVSRTCPNYCHPATGTASANCRLGTEPRCPASTGLAHNRQVCRTGHSFHGSGSRSRLTKEMRL